MAYRFIVRDILSHLDAGLTTLEHNSTIGERVQLDYQPPAKGAMLHRVLATRKDSGAQLKVQFLYDSEVEAFFSFVFSLGSAGTAAGSGLMKSSQNGLGSGGGGSSKDTQLKSIRPFLFPLQMVDGPGLVCRSGRWHFFSYTRFDLLNDRLWTHLKTGTPAFQTYLGTVGRRRLHHLYYMSGVPRQHDDDFFYHEDYEFVHSLLDGGALPSESTSHTPELSQFLAYLSHPNNLYTKSFLGFDRVIKTAIIAFAFDGLQIPVTAGQIGDREGGPSHSKAQRTLLYNPTNTLNRLRAYISNEKNPFYSYHIRNKLTVFGEYGPPQGAKMYARRMFHPSYWGFIAPYQTPESERIGLVQEKASGALYRDDVLWNRFIVNGSSHELSIDDIVEQGYHFQPIAAEQVLSADYFYPDNGFEAGADGQEPGSQARGSNDMQIRLEDAGDGFSAVFRLIPFINHNDASRLLMAVKNYKQALPLKDGEEPVVSTADSHRFKEHMQSFYHGHEYGVNLLTAYLPYYGYNFEDGIVISETAAAKLTSIHTSIIEFSVCRGDRLICSPEHRQFTLAIDDEERRAELLTVLRRRYPGFHFDLRESRLRCRPRNKSNFRPTAVVKLPEHIGMAIPEQEYTFIVPAVEQFHFGIRFEEERPAEVGDKIIGRHANKGVITKIVPEKEMPFFGARKRVEVLINPMSVVSRMNIGQLMEVGYRKDNARVLPLFYEYSAEDFKPTGIAEYRGGMAFPATHGYQYFLKLDHCAEDKVYFNTRPRNSYLGYYVKGKRNLGGMRFGEMELWGLQAHSAYALTQQLLQRYAYEERLLLSPVVKTLGWYLLLLHLQLEVSKNGSEFIPFYQEERLRKTDRITHFRFRRIDQLDELKKYFGTQMQQLRTISEFQKHVSAGKETTAPGYVQLSQRPEAAGETLVSYLEGMPALLVLPGGYLLSNLNKSLHDSLSETVYYRVLTAGNRENRFYPLVSRKGEDWGYKLVSGLISGKRGLLRTQLLGRRVSSAGRAVMVPEPKLALHEVSLPSIYAEEYGGARQSLMIRYPSLFKYNIQQFSVNDRYADKYVVKVNPLICSMVAGDFDGDAMTFMAADKLFPRNAAHFTPVENLYHEGDGSIFLHLSQDLTYAYHLLRTHQEYSLLAERLRTEWLAELCAQHENLKDFAEAARRSFEERESYIRFMEQFVQALFEYITRDRPYTVSIRDLDVPGSIAATRRTQVNHLRQIIATGARGKTTHLEKMTRQASGAIYLMTPVAGEAHHGASNTWAAKLEETKHEFPLSTCLRDGLTPRELAFFSNDARAGLGEKKLKTPDGGEFNRRIHEILYDVEIDGQETESSKSPDAVRSACMVEINRSTLDQLRQAVEAVLGEQSDEQFRANVLGFLRLRSYRNAAGEAVQPEEAVTQLYGGETADYCLEVSSPLAWNFDGTDRIPASCFGYRNHFEPDGYTAGERIGLIAASIIGEQGTQLAMKSFQGENLVPLDMVGRELTRALAGGSGKNATVAGEAAPIPVGAQEASTTAEVKSRQTALLAHAFTIYCIYGGKVRPVFIELLLAYLRDKTAPGSFNPLHYHSLPWKGGLYNLAFGFFRDNIRQLYREAEEGLVVPIDESYQYRLMFDQFDEEGRQ